MRLILFSVCLVITFSGCKKKRTPMPPEAALLIFPEKNSECTTGQSLGQETSQVEFQWAAADHTETYELRVTNTTTGTTQTITSTTTSAKLPLAKGEQFSWIVRSKNSQVEQTVSSEMWSFYNSGSRTTFAPFPATIISPESSDNVFKDLNNEVTLSWSASDLDDDIVSYDVYFSVETPPVDLAGTLQPTVTSMKVSVTADTVYYWKIVVTDAEGNKSDTGIYNFRVL
ncbi:hypothetical protein A9200_01830 [Maribacter hydrothermalis]|uniref:Fibronectin type-III domain-containing protein n=2 Tax=Maribacter hydrothermalis TaxID=1836467 RepID=A0A1B7ZFQ7_9FLAO|nr:hypothetical protein BTR34_10205 [Maribacter hydrothermalis]OBR42409.1 hypothetical protein A9200_01830 [Maribacter hydrothermalis]